MIALFEAAKQLQDFSDRQAWRSRFIGGIAVQRWGEPRVTRGVDLALLTGFGREDLIVLKLSASRPLDIAGAYRRTTLGLRSNQSSAGLRRGFNLAFRCAFAILVFSCAAPLTTRFDFGTGLVPESQRVALA